MKHKVADLEGALLDAVVAKLEGWLFVPPPFVPEGVPPYWWEPVGDVMTGRGQTAPQFSSSWLLGGPIIERERIGVLNVGDAAWVAWVGPVNLEDMDIAPHQGEGPTYLIAAMRAYVALKFGEEIELP